MLAHELSHVANRDILVSSIAAGIGMSITFISRMAFWFGGDDNDNPLGAVGALASLILAPLAAMLIQMAVSRSREYQADESGAYLSHDPEALASALQKLEQTSRQVPAPRERQPGNRTPVHREPVGVAPRPRDAEPVLDAPADGRARGEARGDRSRAARRQSHLTRLRRRPRASGHRVEDRTHVVESSSWG